MSEGFELPPVTKEHELLASTCGTWNVDCTYFMDPSQPPMKTKAVETVEPVGAYWTVSHFKSDMMGAPFAGRATMGYDTRRKTWVGTWIDSMSTHLFVMEGTLDDDGTLEMRCEGPCMVTGNPTTFRGVHKNVGGDSQSFDFFTTMPDGNEVQMFHYEYTKA